MDLVVFSLNHQRFALQAAAVARVVRAVEVTPLPGAPEVVLGLINVGGAVLPVIGMRRRLGLAGDEGIKVTDEFIIARTSRRSVVLAVDGVQEVISCDRSNLTKFSNMAGASEKFEGTVRLADGLILVHDLERFLSLEEEKTLEEALARNQSSK